MKRKFLPPNPPEKKFFTIDPFGVPQRELFLRRKKEDKKKKKKKDKIVFRMMKHTH